MTHEVGKEFMVYYYIFSMCVYLSGSTNSPTTITTTEAVTTPANNSQCGK